MKGLRVAIACGGTGGHLFPGIAVAEELQKRGHDAMVLISTKKIDGVAIGGRDDLFVRELPGMGWPGLFSPRIFSFVAAFLRARGECMQIFKDFQPSVVLGMGGFVSAVPVMVARKMDVPVLLHESNAFPGRVTRMFADYAEKILIGLEGCRKHLPGVECSFVGTPVRGALGAVSRRDAADFFKLDPAKKTLLVMGGSQGARGLNELVLKAIPSWAGMGGREWQFVHLTGEADKNIVEINYRRNGMKAAVYDFLCEMQMAYGVADAVVCRSGAASLAEIAGYGLPSVLVPYPEAADDHQSKNAQVFVDGGAAVVFDQRRVDSDVFAGAVADIFLNDKKRGEMAAAALRMGRSDSAACVADEVESCAKK